MSMSNTAFIHYVCFINHDDIEIHAYVSFPDIKTVDKVTTCLL